MEVSQVRKRLAAAIERTKRDAQARRQRAAEAEHAFGEFLERVATPLVRMLANALKVEGHHFTVFTPSGRLRLASDRGRDDFIELALDTSTDPPQVVARISYTRGSRTVTDERPVKPAAVPDAITEEDLLEFLLGALEPWLAR